MLHQDPLQCSVAREQAHAIQVGADARVHQHTIPSFQPPPNKVLGEMHPQFLCRVIAEKLVQVGNKSVTFVVQGASQAEAKAACRQRGGEVSGWSYTSAFEMHEVTSSISYMHIHLDMK
jgi:hypothetical protein